MIIAQEWVPKPEIFEKIQGIKLKHIDGIKKILSESDMTYLVFYFMRHSNNSQRGAIILESIANRLKYMAGIILVDCSEIIPQDLEMCKKDPEAADGFPRMELYYPNEFKFNPYTKKLNEHQRLLWDQREVSESLIYNWITRNIPTKSQKLNAENIDNFLNNMDYNKVILFTDKPKTPLLFRGISNFFYDLLLFGEVDKQQTALLKKFKVKIFPTLIVYQTHENEILLDEPIIVEYPDKINSEEIAKFLSEYTLNEKAYLRNRTVKDEEAARYKVNFKEVHPSKLVDYMAKFKMWKFVIYSSNGSEEVPDDVKKLNKMTNGFFHFLRVNCKGTEDACKELMPITNFPSLLLVKHSKASIRERLKAALTLPMNYNDIYSEIQQEYPANFKEANAQSFPVLLNEVKATKRTPFIYLYSGDELPLGLHLLNSDAKYSKYVDFIIYENPTKEFLTSLKVKSLPQMIILLQGDDSESAKILTYNEELVFGRLRNFIDMNFNVEKNKKTENEDETLKDDIEFFSNSDSFNKLCIEGKKKICVIGFLDGRSKQSSVKNFDNSFKIFNEAMQQANQKGKPTTFGWVNATCQEDFSNLFNINSESLPNLVFYVPSRNLYTSLLGTFDIESIHLYIERVMNGKIPMNKIEKEKMVLKDIKCEDIKDQVENLEDDEILREIIEEEKKKREAFDKERQQPDQKKKRRKKKKKDL